MADNEKADLQIQPGNFRLVPEGDIQRFNNWTLEKWDFTLDIGTNVQNVHLQGNPSRQV